MMMGILWPLDGRALAGLPNEESPICNLLFTCPPTNGGIFICAEDVPDADPTLVTVLDSCGTVFLTTTDSTVGSGCGVDTMLLRRTYVITDGTTTDSCVQIFYVIDNRPPTIECPGDELVSCPSDVPAADSTSVTIEESCAGPVTLTFQPDIIIDSVCLNHYTIIRISTAEDACGNVSSHHHAIVVNDQVPPAIACPPDMTISCEDVLPLADLNSVQVSDNCEGAITVSVAPDVIQSGICVNTYNVLRMYQATDACGNTSTCVQTISVVDNTAPVLELPEEIIVACAADVPPPDISSIVVSNDCSSAMLVTFEADSISNYECANSYLITRIYNVTDGCGNSASITQLIQVEDNLPPAINCPPNVTVSCTSEVPVPNVADVFLLDNCICGLTANVQEETTTNLGCPDNYIITRIYAVVDSCGNSATCVQTITVEDNTVPTMICPDDITVDCADDVPAADVTLIVSSDNCNLGINITVNPDVIAQQVCPNNYSISRIYRAEDLCGNTSVCLQTISVLDIAPPAITCPANITLSGCNALVPAPDISNVTVSEGCGNATVTFVSDVADTTGCNQVTVRTYMAEDACGNSATCSQTITRILDTVPPTITCAANVTLSDCDGVVPTPDVNNVTVSDGCGNATVTFVSDVVDTTGCNQVTVRTYRATDACGNAATCSQTFTTTMDVAPPTITCAANITLSDCDGVVPTPDVNNVTVSDGCGNATVTFVSDVVDTTGCSQVTVRTYRATDACENAATCSQTITRILDTVPPTITCAANITLSDCDGVVPAPDTNSVNVSDGCGNATVTFLSDVIDTTGCNQVTVRTYRATDACGNAATCSQTITRILDTVPPTITCAANITLSDCDGVVPAPDTNSVNVSDGCGNATVTFVSDVVDTTGCNQVTVRTYRAEDACGNAATCSQTITRILDTVPPTITCAANITLSDCDGVVPAPDTNSVNVSDGCGNATVTFLSDVIDTTGCNQVTVRTYRATDACGNAATCSQTITRILDTVPPTITCAANITLSDCDGVVPTPDTNSVNVSDGCGNATVTFVSDIVDTTGCNQVTVRTYRATDACGNAATCSQTITRILDTVPPTITCAANITLSDCDGVVPAPDTNSVNVSDGCGNATVTFVSDIVDTTGCNQITVRTYRATDACGNAATCSQTITRILDTVAPIITCAANITLSDCDGVVPAPDTNSVNVSDGCGNATVTFVSDVVDTTGCNQVTVRTYRATDACGNAATCSQTITQILDTVPPTITCAANITLSDCDGVVPAPDTNSVNVSDGCGNATVTFVSDVVDTTGCNQVIVRTYRATDACGNAATCSQTITITLDTAPPTITCPEDITLSGCNGVVPSPDLDDVTVFDGCGNTSVTFVSDVVDTTGCNQVTIRTYRAVDACGNAATCSQTITTTFDTAPPSITCAANITISYCNGVVPTPDINSVAVSDGCGNATVTFVSDVVDTTGCNQVTVRTYRATDACGNAATCSQTITRTLDTAPPTITCAANITLSDCNGVVPSPDINIVTVSDGCSNATVTFVSDVVDTTGCNQVTVRTYRAEDACGNSATCSQTITTTLDIAPPTITCAANITLSDCNGVVPSPDINNVTVSDGCGNATVTFVSDDIDTTGCTQVIVRTYRAEDACGNAATCSQTITSTIDTGLPIITCPANITISCQDEIPLADISLVVVNDNCSDVVVSVAPDEISDVICENQYTITRVYTATDACNNVATCTQTIVINDNIGPSLTCVAEMNFSCADQVPLPDIATIIIVENCGGEVTLTVEPDIITDQTCPNHYTLTRTYIGTDECGNTTSYVQVFMINDQTPPAIQCPTNITVACSEDIPSADVHLVSTTDNCSGDVIVTVAPDQISSLLCPNSYVITRVFTATDLCGNQATCAQTISVQDNIAPVFSCPVDITVECDDIPAPNTEGLQAFDGCGGSVTIFHISDDTTGLPCQWVIERMYGATDMCGNTATCVQEISILDTVALPEAILILAPDLTVQCYGQDSTWDIPHIDAGHITVSGGCMDEPNVTFTTSIVASDSCDVEGYIAIYTYVWTVSDTCGNTAVATSYMTLIDSIPPVIYGVPADITVSADSIPTEYNVYALDECLCACVMLSTDSPLGEGCLDGQIITRTWTSKDACGNETIETQRITIRDQNGPAVTLQLPEGYDIEHNDELEFSCAEGGLPAFMNAFDENSIIHNDTTGNVSVEFVVNQTLYPTCETDGYSELNMFTWTVEDACGNTTVFSFTAALVDDEAPEIFGVPDYSCMGDQILDLVTSTDNCSGHVLSYSDLSIENPCGTGTAIRRTYIAIDSCGNFSSDEVIIVPDDNINPQMSFTHPELIGLVSGDSVMIECDAQEGLYSSYSIEDVNVLALCPQGVSVDFEEQLISTSDCEVTGTVGLVRLLWTATDYCGNFSTAYLIGTIVDETPPVILQADDITVGCDEDLPVPTAVDNCSEVAVMHLDQIIPGNCAGEYDIRRSITAIDQCGNTTVEMQNIHLGNSEGPVLEGLDTVVCDDLSMPDITAFDECQGVYVEVTMTQDTLATGCQEGIVIRRTWTAEDECGDITEVEQLIVMGDTSAPVITIPNGSIILQFVNQDTIPNVLLSNSSTMNALNELDANSVIVADNCDQTILALFDIVTLVSDSVQGDGYTEQRYYSWIAVDVCGNSDTIDFVVNIIDDMPPVVGLPENLVLICVPLPEPDAMVPIDSTEILSVVYSETIVPGNIVGQFNVTRTWTISDVSGNVTVVVQHILWTPDTFLECDIISPEQVSCNSREVLISSMVTGGVGPYTYLWDIQGEDCSIQSGQHTPDIRIYMGWADVHITLYVTDAYGCLTICNTIVSCTGDGIGFQAVESQEVMENTISHVSIGPNPVRDFITVSYDATQKVNVGVKFYDYTGRIVQMKEFTSVIGRNEHRVIMDANIYGIYMVQVETPAGILTKPIVILSDD